VNRELLQKAASNSLKKQVPSFQVGDTVTVSVRIVEGEKERIQPFRGTVIARRGGGVSQTFTVRRIVNNEGVERTFPLHSPALADVEVISRGRTRRAKLYYLRQRTGKATRLREVATERARGAVAEGPAETEEPSEAQEDREEKEE